MTYAELKQNPNLTVVTMSLGSQTLAIPAHSLREILDPLPVTRVPGAGSFVPGVVNVRGSVVPIANLCIALAIPSAGVDDRHRILVLDIELDGDPITIAVHADAVHEVATIETDIIEQMPTTANTLPPEFVSGLYKAQQGFVLLPDLPAIFSSQGHRILAA